MTVVLAVGRFLRMYVNGIAWRIMFEELPDPTNILDLCQAIFTAREEGDLWLEEELYRELIEVWRDPQSIIEKTKIKIE